MKIISLFFIGCFLFSCKPKNENEVIKYSYVQLNRSGEMDTVVADVAMRNNIISDEDSLFYERNIVVNNQMYTLRKYSNLATAPIDGGYSYYMLDGFGILFYSQHTWRFHQRLISNNDSINRIFETALSHIIHENEGTIESMYERKIVESTLDFRDFIIEK